MSKMLNATEEFEAVCDAWFQTHSGESTPPPASFSAALHRLDKNLDNAMILGDVTDNDPSLIGWFK